MKSVSSVILYSSECLESSCLIGSIAWKSTSMHLITCSDALPMFVAKPAMDQWSPFHE